MRPHRTCASCAFFFDDTARKERVCRNRATGVRMTASYDWCSEHETEDEFEARRNLPILETEVRLAWLKKL